VYGIRATDVGQVYDLWRKAIIQFLAGQINMSCREHRRECTRPFPGRNPRSDFLIVAQESALVETINISDEWSRSWLKPAQRVPLQLESGESPSNGDFDTLDALLRPDSLFVDVVWLEFGLLRDRRFTWQMIHPTWPSRKNCFDSRIQILEL
jgi:hypothetical protein